MFSKFDLGFEFLGLCGGWSLVCTEEQKKLVGGGILSDSLSVRIIMTKTTPDAVTVACIRRLLRCDGGGNEVDVVNNSRNNDIHAARSKEPHMVLFMFERRGIAGK